MFCAFGFYFILLALPFRFCSSLFSFSAATPGMIVLQGSLIPCRITDAQICHPLSRVFLSLFLCRVFCLSGYNLLDRVLPFCISSAANQPLFFPIPGSGDDRNLFFMSTSPWAFLKFLSAPVLLASHAVVFRGVVLPSSEKSNTTPLKTTAWEATVLHVFQCFYTWSDKYPFF